MTSKVKSHGFVTKGIHWVSAGLIGYGYLKGLDNVSQLSDPNVFWLEVFFALGLGALFAVRWFWTNKVAGVTRLPAEAPRWEQFLSKLVQRGLYLSVFGIVGTGMGIAFGFATPILGGSFLDAMIAAHEVSLAILPILLVVHITGALWHKFVRRDGVMESMTGPWPRLFTNRRSAK